MTMLQKIIESIRLLQANLRIFSALTLTVWLPGSILLVYLRLYVFPETIGDNDALIFAQEVRISNVIETMFGPLYIAAIIHAASRLKQGLSVTYGQALSFGARKSFQLFWTRLTTGFIVLLGILLFIVPGIVLALQFALIDMIVTLEGKTGGQARNRSKDLTKGKRWQIFGTMFLAAVLFSVGTSLLSIVISIPSQFVGEVGFFALSVLNECIAQVLSVILVLVLFLFYWDSKQKTSDLSS